MLPNIGMHVIAAGRQCMDCIYLLTSLSGPYGSFPRWWFTPVILGDVRCSRTESLDPKQVPRFSVFLAYLPVLPLSACWVEAACHPVLLGFLELPTPGPGPATLILHRYCYRTWHPIQQTQVRIVLTLSSTAITGAVRREHARKHPR